MIVSQLNIQTFLDSVANSLASKFRDSTRHTVVVTKLDDKYKTESKFVVGRIDPDALLTEEYADNISDILIHELNREEETELFNGTNPMTIYIEGDEKQSIATSHISTFPATTHISKIESNAIISYIEISQRIVLRYCRLVDRKPYETNKQLKAKLDEIYNEYVKINDGKIKTKTLITKKKV